MDRGVERIAGVTARGTDLVTLWSDVSEIVAPLVPNLRGPCCFTLDPASLLMTSHFNPGLYYRLPQEALRDEYLRADAHDMASVARSHAGISTLHEATGGDPSQSPRWRANMTMDGDQDCCSRSAPRAERRGAVSGSIERRARRASTPTRSASCRRSRRRSARACDARC